MLGNRIGTLPCTLDVLLLQLVFERREALEGAFCMCTDKFDVCCAGVVNEKRGKQYHSHAEENNTPNNVHGSFLFLCLPHLVHLADVPFARLLVGIVLVAVCVIYHLNLLRSLA